MKTDIKKIKGEYAAAYSIDTNGFEFIYVQILDGDKLLLLENKLAINGIWLNDYQCVEIVNQFSFVIQPEFGKNIIWPGNEIIIESYKYRGIGLYNKNGMLDKQSPDCVRNIKIIE